MNAFRSLSHHRHSILAFSSSASSSSSSSSTSAASPVTSTWQPCLYITTSYTPCRLKSSSTQPAKDLSQKTTTKTKERKRRPSSRVRILNHLLQKPARPPRPHLLAPPLPTPHAVSYLPGFCMSPPHLLPPAATPMFARTANGEMTDFSRWTKEALVDRIRLLERTVKQQERASPTPGLSDPTPKKKHKGMDHSRYATRFVALKIAYLGKRYGGFEYQPSGALPTIEEELWKALVKACLVSPRAGLEAHEVDFETCDYAKCGRTDRGVSAFGQVVSLRLRSNKLAPVEPEPEATEATEGAENEPTETSTSTSTSTEDLPWEQEIQYCKVINRLLPADIRVLAWCPAPPPTFNARFSCRERKYRYFFTQPAYYGAPLPHSSTPDGRPSGRPADGWLDIEAMRTAARHFVGVHDFRNFCKVDPTKQITNFVRRIFDADIVEETGMDSSLGHYSENGSPGPKVYSFDVRGSAFLWHQIRHMVAIIFLVGQGLESPDVVRAMLDTDANPSRPSYAMADEFPLVLWDCIFPDETGMTARDEGQSNDTEMADDVAADAPWHTWKDNLQWIAPPAETPDSRIFVDGLWREWRAAKIDEILTNRLLDQVTRGHGSASVTPLIEKSHVFEGGDGPRRGGVYKPLLKRQRTMDPQTVNDRFAQQKGFASSADMRAAGNWRALIKARKVEAEAAAKADAEAKVQAAAEAEVEAEKEPVAMAM